MLNPQTTGKAYMLDDDSILYTLMNPGVVRWLDINIKRLLCDYLSIKANANTCSIGGLWDYSYLITPAFKALEGTLLKIGGEIGLDVKKYNNMVGKIFNDKDLEEYYNKVLDKITVLSADQKVDVREWLNNARRILKSLRHTPAHFEGEIQSNITKAFMSGDFILVTIDKMCYTLIQNGLFPSIARAEEKKRQEQKERIWRLRGARMESGA